MAERCHERPQERLAECQCGAWRIQDARFPRKCWECDREMTLGPVYLKRLKQLEPNMFE